MFARLCSFGQFHEAFGQLTGSPAAAQTSALKWWKSTTAICQVRDGLDNEDAWRSPGMHALADLPLCCPCDHRKYSTTAAAVACGVLSCCFPGPCEASYFQSRFGQQNNCKITLSRLAATLLTASHEVIYVVYVAILGIFCGPLQPYALGYARFRFAATMQGTAGVTFVLPSSGGTCPSNFMCSLSYLSFGMYLQASH